MQQQSQGLQQAQQQSDDQRRMQQQRNGLVQGATDAGVDPDQVKEMIKAEYGNVDQPGLHPGNRPGRLLDLKEGERDPHKSTRDLEDITGNPGHLGVNPNAPATSMNPPSPKSGELLSINQPPDVPDERFLPPQQQQPQDYGAYPQQQNTPYPYNPQTDQQQPPYRPLPPY